MYIYTYFFTHLSCHQQLFHNNASKKPSQKHIFSMLAPDCLEKKSFFPLKMVIFQCDFRINFWVPVIFGCPPTVDRCFKPPRLTAFNSRGDQRSTTNDQPPPFTVSFNPPVAVAITKAP